MSTSWPSLSQHPSPQSDGIVSASIGIRRVQHLPFRNLPFREERTMMHILIVAMMDERGESLSPPCGNIWAYGHHTWSATSRVMFAHQAHHLLLCPVLLPRKVSCVACRNVSPGSGGPGRQHRRSGGGRRTVWGTQDPAEESELLQAGGRLQAGPA